MFQYTQAKNTAQPTHMHALSPRHQSGPITHAYLLDLHAYLSRYIYMNDSVLKIHKTSVLF